MLQGPFVAKSVESQLSGGSLRNCSVKETIENQTSVLRIDECLSPASIDSVVIAERDSRNEKYTNASPVNTVDCLEADQVILMANSSGFMSYLTLILICTSYGFIALVVFLV